jgi:hypothetical protein
MHRCSPDCADHPSSAKSLFQHIDTERTVLLNADPSDVRLILRAPEERFRPNDSPIRSLSDGEVILRIQFAGACDLRMLEYSGGACELHQHRAFCPLDPGREGGGSEHGRGTAYMPWTRQTTRAMDNTDNTDSLVSLKAPELLNSCFFLGQPTTSGIS